ncbi:alpha/beta hydrolase fold protein [Xylariaceae sp. FL1019]|nr:alpha/beta hydrolase fold protein [Xylariaceae sp. FL1019]
MSKTTSTIQDRLPILSRISNGASVYVLQTFIGGVMLAQKGYQWFYPAAVQPSFIKTYECRPDLPIRIFFPKSYDQTSSQNLPTVFVVHGGAFIMGNPWDDDKLNEQFASMHNILVIELNYHKAPAHPFPTAIYDVEALMLAVFDDESLPVDKSRIAFEGFSAGGNLILGACQLPSIREKIKPAAAIGIYPVLDQTIKGEEKCKMRHYKPGLGGGMRGKPEDFLRAWGPMVRWSYVPVGQDLSDPLLSPILAPREHLPDHIFLLAAELDQLSHESWRMASKLAGRPVPALTDKTGQENIANNGNNLILDDERFAFEHRDGSGKTVQWLLVPDEVHGFDHIPPSWHGSKEAEESATYKTTLYQQMVGKWLYNTAWRS